MSILALVASAVRVFAADIDPASGNAQPFPGTPIGRYVLAWSDEFNGTALDTAKWNYRTDSRHWSTQLPANVTLGGGMLALNLKKENAGGMAYTGAGVISKAALGHGYYEARMKTPPGAGWHTSFWMMRYDGSGGTGTGVTSIEVDALENDSISPLKYGVNLHRWNPTPHATFGSKTVTTPSLNAGFHVIGCEYTAATVKYFFDGALVQTVDATQFPHNDLNVWLTSIASYLGGTTAVDDTQLPAMAQFDYARFFTPAPPPPEVVITSPAVAAVSLADAAMRLRVAANVTATAGTPVIAWTQLSGPGAVTFADATAADTRAIFSTEGTYVLQCAATTAAGTGAAQVSVSVNAPAVLTLREGVNGYTHTATTIRADHADWNAGARDLVLVGRNSGAMRALFSFDLAEVPTGATITSAKLDLWTSSSAGVGTIGALELRALNATPVEGTGIGDGTSSNNGTGTGATWLLRTPTNSWTSAGGDFSSTVLSTLAGYDATVTGTQRTLVSTTAFVAAAQSAAGAGQPLNLILSATNESSGGNFFTRLASDDAASASVRPQLTLSFSGSSLPQVSPGPTPVAFAGSLAPLAGSTANATNTLWSVVSGQGAVTFSDATALATIAIFTQPGSYVLRLSAANALGETSRDLAVNVAPHVLQILPLGDSITQGAGAAGGYRDPLRTLLAGAGMQIQFIGSRTDNATAALTSASQTHHEGHGSYSSDLLLGNLDAVLAPYAAPYGTPPDTNGGGFWLTGTGTRAALFPDVILLMIGTNDLGMFRHTPAQTRDFYDALLTKLASLRPTAHIVCSTLIPYNGDPFPPGKDYSHRESDGVAFNALLGNLVVAHQSAGHRVWLCDMRGKISTANASSLIGADGVHPNSAGYAAIAAGWFDALGTLPFIENWRAANFGNAANAGNAADSADPDADGLTNLVEYSLGTDPTRSENTSSAMQRSFVTDLGAEYLALTFHRRKNTDVRCIVEVSPDLATWTAAAPFGSPTALDPAFEQVTFRDTVPKSQAARRFIRLRMEK